MNSERNIPSNAEILKKIHADDNKVIGALLKTLAIKVKGQLQKKGLDNRDIEEVLLDSLTIFIDKVKSGQIEDRGIPLIAYLIKVAHIRSHYYLRRNKMNIVPLDNDLVSSFKSEVKSFENWDIVKIGLEKLAPHQKHLIELTYIQVYNDKDILTLGLTDYTSVDSIKSQRHKYLKKLIKIVKDIKSVSKSNN